MLDTLLAMIESGEIALAHTRTELLGVITTILEAGRAGDLRADITAEDIAASLIGILTVVGKPEQHARANRLLDLLWTDWGPGYPARERTPALPFNARPQAAMPLLHDHALLCI